MTKTAGDSDGIRKINKSLRHWLRRLRKGGSAVAQDRYGIEMAVKVLRQRKGVVWAEVSVAKGHRFYARFVNGMAKPSRTSWFTLWPPSTTPGLLASMDFTTKILRAMGPSPLTRTQLLDILHDLRRARCSHADEDVAWTPPAIKGVRFRPHPRVPGRWQMAMIPEAPGAVEWCEL